MKNLFDADRAIELRTRLEALTPRSERQWGTMTAPQMLAHLCVSFENALGVSKPPRMFIGRLIGGLVKRSALGDDAPIKKNSPTAPGLKIRDDRDLNVERARLRALIDRFVTEGPRACTSHPHTFFGPMTPDDWAVLMYKHTDHHFRQFGV